MSSMYNMINGVNPATFLILPMLGKNPNEYPRFRDCKVYSDGQIVVLTRTGGFNRVDYAEENQIMETMATFINSVDASDDNTYAFWVFEVPEEWKTDFDKIIAGQKDISDEYKKQILTVYPDYSDTLSKWLNGE